MTRTATSTRRRRLGQHFLRDRRAVERLLGAFDPGPGDAVLEIGPGDGALTRPLAQRVSRLLAVEVDPRLAASLRRGLAAAAGVQVLTADILDLEVDAAARLLGCAPGERFRVLGNLPYRIATVILGRLVPRGDCIRDLHVMVQREVARRLLASPGGGDYGALSVFVALHADGRRVLDLPPGAFSPPPEVHSTVVALELRSPPPPGEAALRDAAVEVAERAFTHRRKMLANALAAAGVETDRVARALEASGLDGRCRPQELAPGDWLRLAPHLVPPAVP